MRRRMPPVVKAVLVAGACLLVTTPLPSAPRTPDTLVGAVYLDPSYSPMERAADLVSRLTLEEKATQMISSQSVAIPRLGIAAYGWWNEAAHGVAREGTVHEENPPTLVNTTSYPVSLSVGATWNPDLFHRQAVSISDEAREVVRENRLDLNFYSPTVNLARDPRWGRNDEAFSEDPYLTTRLAAQFVNGMEGKDRGGRPLPEGGGYLKTSTTIKHYAANNSEFNRRDGTSDMDERTLREYYTRQFRDIIRLSDPASIMTSYNRVNGVPTTASVHLMDTLARRTFGFRGFFTSDCDSIFEIQGSHQWQPAGASRPLNEIERHAYANSAGNDLNCQQGYHDDFSYANTVPAAVAEAVVTETGTYTENDVDAALVRLFAVRIALGEFDDPSRVEWVAQARARVPAGTWTNSDANNAVTQTGPRLALAREVAGEAIVLLKNEPPGAASGRPLLPLRVPRSGPFRVAIVGHYANPATMYLGGYSSDQQAAGQRRQVNGFQGLWAAVVAANPDALVDHLPGVSADLDDVDQATVDSVADYDAVVVYVGDDDRHSREDVDRTSLALPGAQAELVRQVVERNPATAVYIESSGAVDVSAFADAAPAILWSSYNGQRKGEALADVVLGTRAPSGRLPFTWYAGVADLPSLGDYAIRPGPGTPGRTYMYFQGRPAFPFGHGLTYTRFTYGRPVVERSRVDANDEVRLRVGLTNTGDVEGSEVVQLYVSTPDARPGQQRPAKRLVGFEKVRLEPGQATTVEFVVGRADLAFFDEESGRWVVDPGRYAFEVGGSSADTDVRGRATVRVSGELRPELAVATLRLRAADDGGRGVPHRTVFAPGTVVEPRLTIALSDDRLSGAVTQGPDVALPADVRVTYRSNRPGVVTVDGGGALRTVGSGVATVTADVERDGVRITAEAVVAVK